MHELVVRAALDRRRKHVYHGAMVGSQTGRALTADALLKADGNDPFSALA